MPAGLLGLIVAILVAILFIRKRMVRGGSGFVTQGKFLRVVSQLFFPSPCFRYQAITVAFWVIAALHVYGLASPLWDPVVAGDIEVSRHGIIAHLLLYTLSFAWWFAVWLYLCQDGPDHPRSDEA